MVLSYNQFHSRRSRDIMIVVFCESMQSESMQPSTLFSRIGGSPLGIDGRCLRAYTYFTDLPPFTSLSTAAE